MKSQSSIYKDFLIVGLSICLHAAANNIAVTAISLSNRNTSTQTVRINFNLTWENSWRTTSAPFNWDAAWVFVKYKEGTNGTWKHATLATSGHTIPSLATSTQSDATGLFLYRSSSGSGTFSPSGIQLIWNYGTDGVANDAKIIVRVFAIEMVYIPPGGFQAGSGGQNSGEFRTANDISSSGTATTFTITGTSPTLQGNSSSASPSNIAAYNNTSTDLSGTATASLASGFPTGFDAFYSMKYEISQQQYVDFLNTLTYTQQAARTATAPNSAPGTGAMSSANAYRNGIDIQVSGTSTNFPAVYACNLNGNSTYNEANDGQHIACSYLSWDDLTAYLDWAGLRPMTELEYEKSCRGNQNPLPNEYAWGSTSATALSGVNNAGATNEIASNTGANIVFAYSYSGGPVRTGIFATNSSNRSSSGAGYYGNMEHSGNLWERIVTIGNATGRSFSAANGNGNITNAGASDVSGWVSVSGTGYKGGGWENGGSTATTSDRLYAAYVDPPRYEDAGGRGVRTVTTGIVTNGLILWLDAGITTSYPGSGSTWFDLSGNKNNATLGSGITYNDIEGGAIVFPNSNAMCSGTYPLNYAGGGFTIEVWLKHTGTVSSSRIQRYFTMVSSPTEGPVLRHNSSSNASLHGYIFDATNTFRTIDPTNQIYSNTFYQLIVTYDGSNMRVYNNNNQVGILSGSFSLPTPTSSYLLGLISGEWFEGNMYIVRYYNKGLSASEISQNFNAQKARFGL